MKVYKNQAKSIFKRHDSNNRKSCFQEVLKLKSKISTSAQILTHNKEKSNFLEKMLSHDKEELADVEKLLAQVSSQS